MALTSPPPASGTSSDRGAGTRPVVLAFAAVYWPGYKAGGPIRSMRNMVTALHEEIDFRIFTSDRDRGAEGQFTEVAINRWNDVDGAKVFYADKKHRLSGEMCRIVAAVNPDVVYVNSFFDRTFAIRPVRLRRLSGMASRARWVIAPRGEFSPGALAIKPCRKRFFIATSRLTGLHRDMDWQATSDLEATDIARTMGIPPARILTAPNLTDVVPREIAPGVEPQSGGPLRVCFLSRITPKKNLAYAIDVLARLPFPVEFNVFGPIADAAYWQLCQKRLQGVPESLQVRVHGEIPHEQVRATLATQDLFFFPTLGENFGHVIFEALAAGVPVLLSDQTPWRDLEPAGVGWVRPLDDPDEFRRIIERVAGMPAEQRAAQRIGAHAYAATLARSSDTVARTRALFVR